MTLLKISQYTIWGTRNKILYWKIVNGLVGHNNLLTIFSLELI